MQKITKLLFILIFSFSNLLALNNFENLSYINTKNISYNEKLNTIILGENSLININGNNILTNRGVIDYNNDKIELFGNIYIYHDNNILSAYNLKGNTSLSKFSSEKVNYIYNGNMKVDSQFMERNNNELYFYDNFLTPCKLDGYFDCPTWSLKIPKTIYIIDQDKFIHFDSFLQIADKKIFYLPYFSHYGAKAERKSGFLNPTIDFNLLNGGTDLKIPYYIPFNVSSDLVLTPIIGISSDFFLSDKIEINSLFSNRSAGGKTKIELTTKIAEEASSFYNSIGINTKQTINKNHQMELNGLFTNSISSTRSYNDNQLNYENIYLRSNLYSLFNNSDILISEIGSIASFDNSENSLIPIQLPNLKYINTISVTPNVFMNNNLDFYYLVRNGSNDSNPSKNLGLNISNEFINHSKIRNFFYTNKIIFNNTFRKITDENLSLNQDYYFNNYQISSKIDKYLYKDIVKAKLKFIINDDLVNNSYPFNEDSRSMTLNYFKLFEEKRLYGYDKNDNSKRIAYGIDYQNLIKKNTFKLSVGQSYDLKTNNNFLEQINQDSKFSDVLFNSLYKMNNISFIVDGRLNQRNLTKKEINYSILYQSPIEIALKYNETSKEAYKDFSDDSKALIASLGYGLNDNIKIYASSNLDLKNSYQPFTSSLNLKFFDECSEFNINYSNTRFSDNFNTVPKETIGLSFRMDYLGFFGYQQQTDLFFKKKGTLNYGF